VNETNYQALTIYVELKGNIRTYAKKKAAQTKTG